MKFQIHFIFLTLKGFGESWASPLRNVTPERMRYQKCQNLVSDGDTTDCFVDKLSFSLADSLMLSLSLCVCTYMV